MCFISLYLYLFWASTLVLEQRMWTRWRLTYKYFFVLCILICLYLYLYLHLLGVNVGVGATACGLVGDSRINISLFYVFSFVCICIYICICWASTLVLEQRQVDSLETHTPAAQWRHEPPQGNNYHLFHCWSVSRIPDVFVIKSH